MLLNHADNHELKEYQKLFPEANEYFNRYVNEAGLNITWPFNILNYTN